MPIEYCTAEDQAKLVGYVTSEYEVDAKELDGITFLAHVLWGECYEESEWFLLKNSQGELFENAGCHCSCHGFEGQWGPEHSSVAYLLSDKLSIPALDRDERESELSAFRAWVAANLVAP